MSLTSPVSCVYDAFSSYIIYFCLIYCNWYYPTNHICSMISLAMMGLTPGPLVRALFLFSLMNPLVVLDTLLFVLDNLLVVSAAWGMAILSQQ